MFLVVMVVSTGPRQLFAGEGRGNLGQKPNFGDSLQLVCSCPLHCRCLTAFCSAGLCSRYVLVCPSAAPSSRPQALPSGGAKGFGQRQAESRLAQEHAISYLGKEGR